MLQLWLRLVAPFGKFERCMSFSSCIIILRGAWHGLVWFKYLLLSFICILDLLSITLLTAQITETFLVLLCHGGQSIMHSLSLVDSIRKPCEPRHVSYMSCHPSRCSHGSRHGNLVEVARELEDLWRRRQHRIKQWSLKDGTSSACSKSVARSHICFLDF